jgi:hypothetical protein
MSFELEAVDAHAALLQRQPCVGFPFRPHEFRERDSHPWLMALLFDRGHSRLEDFECFGPSHLTDEADCFATLNAADRSVWFHYILPPAEHVAFSFLAANYQTAALVPPWYRGRAIELLSVARNAVNRSSFFEILRPAALQTGC